MLSRVSPVTQARQPGSAQIEASPKRPRLLYITPEDDVRIAMR